MGSVDEILVVQPDPKTGLGRCETWLLGAGATVRTLHPYAGDALPERLDVGGAGIEAGAITVDLTLAAAEDELFVGVPGPLPHLARLRDRPEF